MKNFLLAVSLVFLIGCGSENSTEVLEVQLHDDITGTWVGTVTQTDSAKYTMEMKLNSLITNTTSGTIDYPTLNCGGTLTLIETNDTEYIFQEKLTRKANCVDNGIVKIKKLNNGLKWNWDLIANPYDYAYAYANLIRK